MWWVDFELRLRGEEVVAAVVVVVRFVWVLREVFLVSLFCVKCVPMIRIRWENKDVANLSFSSLSLQSAPAKESQISVSERLRPCH